MTNGLLDWAQDGVDRNIKEDDPLDQFLYAASIAGTPLTMALDSAWWMLEGTVKSLMSMDEIADLWGGGETPTWSQKKRQEAGETCP